MNRFPWFIMLLIASTFGCGKNNGTPPPTKPGPSADVRQNDELPTEIKLAENSQWRAMLTWNNTPRFSDEELVEITGVIDFLNLDGTLPDKIENISLVADMPEMGHGTGNNLPRVMPVLGEPGRWGFDNLIFTMTGNWRIRILATVDGKADVWSMNMDVQ